MADTQPQQPDPSIEQGVQGVPGLPTMSPESLAKLQAFIDRPALKKYVALVQNPEFTDDLMALVQHPQLKQCGQWELGWLVVLIIFRSWWMSKSTHWLKGLMISLWCMLLFWAVTAIAIPSYFLSPAYTKLLKDTWRLLG
jgi:hypothetical protein